MLIENGVMIDWGAPITIRMIHICQKCFVNAVNKNDTENMKVAKVMAKS